MLEEALRMLAAIASRQPAESLPRRLDELFVQLAEPSAARDAYAIEDEIWELWTSYPEPGANQSMDKAIAAIASKQYQEGISLLNDMVERYPLWPEVWNKRATLRFLMRQDAESIRDIGRTLELEPRHFGALSGLVQILVRNGALAEAMFACEVALRLNPHSTGLKALGEQLRAALPTAMH